MRDCGISVLEQYELDVYSTRRIRGAVLCDTDRGLFLLKEVPRAAARFPVLEEVYRKLQENGLTMTDIPLKNREGALVSCAADGTSYMVKKWFQGRECDVRRESELKEASRQLARIHQALHFGAEWMPAGPPPLAEEFERHSRELRKVRNFIRRRSLKGEFEYAFLQAFDEMYFWAETARERLEKSRTEELRQKALEGGDVIHGDYNYHNILICPQGIAVTCFEHAHRDIQLADFYYFLRKTLEKNRFDERTGYQMMRGYDSVLTLGKVQREYLAIRLCYPEKFWKTANTYFHSSKAWIPAKNVEKLQLCVAQNKEKKKFLENLFAFHF